MPLKEKLTTGPAKCQKNHFSPFQFLNEFLSEDSEVEDTAEIKELMLEHLKLLKKNCNRYFPKEESEAFRLLKWVVNPFIFILPEQEELLDICNDIIWRKSLKKMERNIFGFFCSKREQQLQRKH